MKVVVQKYSTGELLMLDVTDPVAGQGALVVQTAASLVSVGTERSMIDIAKKSLLGKALARPDWVRQVIDKIKTEGVAEAWRQSKARLDMPVPLGYSSAGIVSDICGLDHQRREKDGNGAHGTGNTDAFNVGDRVACAGSGFAGHAEFSPVPENLCVKIPRGVSFDEAAYVALGGIALEAVRMGRVGLGDRVAVIGLGLLGLLAVQILKAAGCHVFGIDVAQAKCDLARELGADAAETSEANVVDRVRQFTAELGADCVIILAAARSNEPLELAAELARERGRVVAAGLVGLEVPRKAFYEKELELVVSRAWGPGMYDPDFERRNVKYPLPYVRWTARENMREFLELVAAKRVRTDRLTTHRFPFDDALDAYKMILAGKEPCIGVILEYQLNDAPPPPTPTTIQVKHAAGGGPAKTGGIGIGLIGAGLYARGTLLPAMQKIKGVRRVGVADRNGLNGQHVADTFGFDYCTSDPREVLSDKTIDAVFVLTRHDAHARLVCESLRAGKAVFVEKPLAITREQLDEVVETCRDLADLPERKACAPPFLMVGFNRRFAPTTKRVKESVGEGGPGIVVHLRCNAGRIPADSWVHKADEGGGRVIGEVCHFVDLAQHLTGGLPVRVFAACAESAEGLRDNLTVSLQMNNGAVASIVYAASGDKSYPREEVEVFANGAVSAIHNFREVEIVAAGKKRRKRHFGVDRGHGAELTAFFEALRRGRAAPVALEEYVVTTLTTFAIEESIATRKAVDVPIGGRL